MLSTDLDWFVELARTRQVVLFTCHEEVVKALRKADPDLTELEL